MKKFLKFFDHYKILIWLVVGLIVVSVCIVPFAPKRLFGIPMTPILVMLPILLGIGYAIIVSYEKPKMTEQQKFKFRLAKAILFIVMYILSIAAFVYALI